MDKLIMASADVQDLQYRIHCAVELVRVAHMAITEDGPNETGEDEHDALFGAYWLLHTLEKEMKETADLLWGSVCELKKE